MIFSIGWGIGYIVTKGIEKLLGHQITDEDISAKPSLDKNSKHFDSDIVTEDEKHSGISAKSSDDLKFKYFGFDEFVEDCMKPKEVSAETSPAKTSKPLDFDIVTEDDVKHSANSEESSVEDKQFKYFGFDVFVENYVQHKDVSGESSSDEKSKYFGFDIVAEDDTKDNGFSGELEEDSPEIKVEEVTINTELIVKTSGDTAAMESVCLPANEMELEFEAHSGDDFVDVPYEQMNPAVKESCESQENLMTFVKDSENSSTEEASSVDENSKDGIQNHTGHFDNLDSKEMDASSKEVDFGNRNAANVVSHFDDVSEYSSSEEWSSEEENSNNDSEIDPNHFDSICAKDIHASSENEEVCSGSPNSANMWTDFGEVYEYSSSEDSSSEEENSEDGNQDDIDRLDCMDVNIFPAMYFCKFSNSFFNCWMNSTTQSIMNLFVVRRLVAQFPEEISDIFAETPLFAQCFFRAMYHPGRDFPPHEVFAVQNELVDILKIRDVKHQDKPGVLLFYMSHCLAQYGIYTVSKLYTADYCQQCQMSLQTIRTLGPVIPLPKEQQNDTTSTLLECYWSRISESCDTCKSNKKSNCFFNNTDVMILILPWPDSPDDIRHPVIPNRVLEVPVKCGTQTYHLSSVICWRQATTSDTSSLYTYLMCGELVFKAEDERVSLSNIDCGADICSNGYIYIYEKTTEGQDEYSVGRKVTTDQQER